MPPLETRCDATFVRGVARDLRGRAEAALAQAPNLQAKFQTLVRTQYGILHDEGSEFIAVLLYDWRSLPAEYKQEIIRVKDRYDALWQTTLQALLQAGVLGANTPHDPEAVTDVKMARLLVMGAIIPDLPS
mgnify:CR=1 FL=1